MFTGRILMKHDFDYVIVGGGLAGASAVEGIREIDETGSILLVCGEDHLPYDRPPLSKELWFGKITEEQIFLHDQKFYDIHTVTLALGIKSVRIDPDKKTITNSNNNTFGYGKLLFATGCKVQTLTIPGGDLADICYFRSLDDYQRTRGIAAEGKSAVVIGGGFIGSELVAALNISKLNVTMIFPGTLLCDRVFPDYLGRSVQRRYA